MPSPHVPLAAPAAPSRASGRELVAAAIAAARARGEQLPRKPRKPRRVHHPFGLEALYFSRLRGAARRLFGEIDRWLEANYSGMLANRAPVAQRSVRAEGLVAEKQGRRDAAARFDDLDRQLSRFEEIVHRRWGRLSPDLVRQAQDIARRVNRENIRVFDEQNRHVLGVSVEAAEPWLADEEAIFAHENAALIRDIGATATRRVAALVTDCVRNGSSTSDLRKAVQEELGIATRRAALIAVDQVGKFNGRLTQRRQQAIGITNYRWRGVLDQRERPAHVAREGVEFAWDDPPSDGNPGEPIRCRCVAEPVMEDFADLLEPRPTFRTGGSASQQDV